jgi:hypothetical protein
MAINTTWKVDIGTVAAPTDFTSRVLSMSIRQSVDVNVMGRGTCVITLLNKDGALTPGGGGTYSSTDWFAQGVFINALTDIGAGATSTDVFDGIITNFELQDDGVFSTVTLTAQDGLTVGGKSPLQDLKGVVGISRPYITWLSTNIKTTIADTSIYPLLGKPNSVGLVDYVNSSTTFDNISNPTGSSVYADGWQVNIIPTANDVCYATIIEEAVQAPYGAVARYRVNAMPYDTTRNAANSVDFEFAPEGSVTGTKLPFSANNFEQAFNIDSLINVATVGGQFATFTSTSSNALTYGQRTVSFNNTGVSDNTFAQSVAQRLTNRYSTPKFTVVQLATSAKLVKQDADDSAESFWRNLLSIQKGLWQKTTITWTGSGASAQTVTCVIKGRTINVTPANTDVSLLFGDWVDNHGFILDTDKLDIDRLG